MGGPYAIAEKVQSPPITQRHWKYLCLLVCSKCQLRPQKVFYYFAFRSDNCHLNIAGFNLAGHGTILWLRLVYLLSLLYSRCVNLVQFQRLSVYNVVPVLF